jgi:uncharacterized protein (DUF2267 family)
MPVMDYQGFIGAVQERAHIPGDEAERVSCATLQTLSERISGGEAEDLAKRLPERLHSCLTETDGADRFHFDEFVRRVAQRADIDESAAQRDSRAVFSALFHAVGPEEFHDMRSELPKDFDPVLDDALRDAGVIVTEPTEPQPGMSFDEFIEDVADRADVDREQAQRIAEVVLEVLAIRLTGGQVEDLEARLPPELHPAMERGLSQSGTTARTLSALEFAREVARRLDISSDDAEAHARAVFTTLRVCVGEKEFRDTIAQLPDDFRGLIAYQG